MSCYSAEYLQRFELRDATFPSSQIAEANGFIAKAKDEGFVVRYRPISFVDFVRDYAVHIIGIKDKSGKMNRPELMKEAGKLL